MRDPLDPIPSPFSGLPGESSSSQRFWRDAPRAPDAPHTSRFEDPRALLGARDTLGIDRRAFARSTATSRGSSVGGALHVPITTFMVVRSQHGCALVRGLSLSPHGVLVRAVDAFDPDLHAHERHQMRSAFMRLAASLQRSPRGDRLGAQRRPSALGLTGSVVLSRRVVADLSRWANPNVEREAGPPPVIPLELIVAVPGSRRASVQVPVRLSPLTDPRPDVLALALGPAARSRLVLALGLPPIKREPDSPRTV